MSDCCPVPGSVGVLVVVFATSLGCATTVKDFRLEGVQPNEAAIAGKVDVIYNGKFYNQKCQLVLGDEVYQLDASGMVFLRVKRGLVMFKRIACQDMSPYHYDFQGAHFTAEGGGVVTYFGNATVDWRTDGGLKASSLFGAIGAAVDSASNDGKAAIWVKEEPARVQAAFVKQVGQNPQWVTRRLTAGR
jgi:hypothetical protein